MQTLDLDKLISQSEARFRAQRLPLINYREEILNTLENNQCLILQADTGLGKTTQLPQYLFLHYAASNPCQIFSTQPRKIAANNASRRINEEFSSELISKSCISKNDLRLIPSSPIIYFSEHMFFNYLLSEIYSEDPLPTCKALIMDEAHERNIETDVILSLVKKYVLGKRPDFKLIVTSATLQVDVLKSYLNCAFINCSGTNHPVQEIFCRQYDNYFKETVNTVIRVVKGKASSSIRETILVFLCGFDELNGAKSIISGKVSMEHVEILLLHGTLDYKDQQIILNTQNKRIRIVISTNIAESSLTVPGVTCVIDSGREKVSVSGQCKDFRVKLITKMSAIQRKGRAGRTCPGICYRIYTNEEYLSMMDFREPAIIKSNNGLLILKFLNAGILEIENLELIDGPDPNSIKETYKDLLNLGLIRKTSTNYKIEEIGKFCLNMDISPMLSRLIYEGFYNYYCADEAAMASSVLLCVDFLFLRTDLLEDAEEDLREDYLLHRDITKLGDIVGALFVFRQYYALLCNGCTGEKVFCSCEEKRKRWSNKYYINEKKLRIALKQYIDLFERLTEKYGQQVYYFSEVEWQLEKALAELSLTDTKSAKFQEKLKEVAKGFEEFYYSIFQDALICSLFQNLAQYRGDKIIDAGYLYVSTREIVVHHPSSPLGKLMFLTPPRYLMFFEVSVTTNLFMKYITPVDINKVKLKCASWLESQNFTEEIEEPEGLVFSNLGPAYMREVFGQNGCKIHDLENELKEKGISGVLILPDMSKNFLKLRLPSSFREIGETELRKVLNYKQKEVLRKNIVQIPFSKGMILVMDPGGIVSDILYNEDNLIYHIKDMKNYANYSEAFSDVQNTFDFYQFNYIKKQSENLGVVYFKSSEQAEEAKLRIMDRPLVGKNSMISSLVPHEKSLPQPLLRIRSAISSTDLKNMLEYYGEIKYLNTFTRGGQSIANVRYSNSQGTESCIQELPSWVRDELNATVQILKLQQGILVPRELVSLGIEEINYYIENINNQFSCEFFLQEKSKCFRVLSDSQETNFQARDLIMDLVNFETIPISIEIMKCLEKSFIFIEGQGEVAWKTWQSCFNVHCVFVHFRSSLAIYGIPNNRQVALEELHREIGKLLKEIITVTINYTSVREMRKIEMFKKRHLSDLQIDISVNRRKAAVSFTGIKYYVDRAIDKLHLEEKKQIDIENCSICTDALLENTVTLNLCGHRFHSKCLNLQIKDAISEAGTEGFPISCVVCGHMIVHNDWCKVLSFNELQSFYNASVINFLSRNNKFDHCENPNCDFVYLIDLAKSQGNKRSCARCKGEFCIICKRQIFGMGHEARCEFNRMEKEDKENHDWIEQNTAMCPNCLIHIEKNAGCNHINCIRCKNHFCFLCGMGIDGLSPINHYTVPNTACYQKYMDN